MKIARSASAFFPLGVLALLFVASAPAAAQPLRDSFEISPYGGWVFGGELSGIDDSVDVDDHLASGVRLGFNMGDHFGLEVGYLHERADLILEGGLDDHDEKVGKIDLDTLDASMLFHVGEGRIRPYFVLGAGATRVDLGGADDDRAHVSIGGGLKAFVAPVFGFRFEARRRWTLLRDTEDDDDHCRRSCSDDALGQTEVTGGLIFAF